MIMIEELVWYDDNKVMTSTSLRTLVKIFNKKLSFDIVQNISKVGLYVICITSNKRLNMRKKHYLEEEFIKNSKR